MDSVRAPRCVRSCELPLLSPVPPDFSGYCGGPDLGILSRIDNVKKAGFIEFVRGYRDKVPDC